MKTVIAILLVLGLGAGGYLYYATQLAAESTTNFRTGIVKRGDLTSTISATGTIEPVDVVDVGAQVVVRIKDFGIDPVDLKGRSPDKIAPEELKKLKRIDYNSVVHEGTILANIDNSVYAAQVAQAQATLKRAEADVIQYKAKLLQAQQDWDRAQQLHAIKIDGPNQENFLKIFAMVAKKKKMPLDEKALLHLLKVKYPTIDNVYANYQPVFLID